MSLQNKQLEALDRDGFVIVGGALDAASTERLRHAFEDAPAQKDGTQHVSVSDTTPAVEAWRALEHHPAIGAASARILGRPFSAHVHGRNPLPGFGQQGLHSDWRPRPAREPYFVMTAIWMLDDFTAANGATRIVPGSHRIVRPLSKSLSQPLARHPGQQIATGRAGDVLIFNGHLWHSGRRNETTGQRRSVQMVLIATDALAQIPSMEGFPDRR